MPIIFIVIGIGILLGVGGYFLRPEDAIQTSNVATTTVEDKNETVVVPDPSTNPTPLPDTAATNETATPDTAAPAVQPVTATPSEPAQVTSTDYSNGQHTVTTTYTAPGNAEHTVTLNATLKDDIVTAVTVSYGGDKVEESSKYQKRFSDNFSGQVIGKSLDGIKLSRVGGASLTTAAFNDAIAKLKIEAKI